MSSEEIAVQYIEFKARLQNLVKRIVGNSEDAEDILQDAYIKTWDASKKNKIESPQGFLTHTARNLAINHINLARIKYNIPLVEDELSTVIDNKGVDSLVSSKERLEHLNCVINGLPPQCKKVFIYKRVYGLTHKEIATKMNISVKTVENHITRGLRECINKMSLFDKDSVDSVPRSSMK